MRDQKLLSAEPRHILPVVGGSRIRGTAGKKKGKQTKPKKNPTKNQPNKKQTTPKSEFLISCNNQLTVAILLGKAVYEGFMV